MKLGKALMLGVAGAALITEGAKAADPILPVVTSAVVAAPVPSFGWAGPYLGAHGGAFFDSAFVFGNWRAGLQAGYNFVFNNMLVGIEGAVAAQIHSGPTFAFDAALTGRFGVLLGGSALLFAEVGVGVPGPAWVAGGGVEFAIDSSLSVFGKALALGGFGGGFDGTLVHVGLNWHPEY